jgi:hypothetical protein
MSKRKTATRIALAAALLASAVYAGLAGYWLSSERIENANERAYVTSPDDEDTRKEVIRRCGGPLPAPAQDCVQQVENAEEAKQRERADLKAQQEVAEWTYGPHRNRADTDRELSHVKARLEKNRAGKASDVANEGKE